LTFSGKKYCLDICSDSVKKYINFLNNLDIFDTDSISKIKANQFNWIFIIKNLTNTNILTNLIEQILPILLNDKTLVYLKINNITYREVLYKDEQIGYQLYLNALSFTQPDDSIQYSLNEILIKIFKDTIIDNLYLIGGQIVLFSKIIKYNNISAFTDTESIYKDALSYDIPVNLINYHTYKFVKVNNDSYLIVNNGKGGMGNNMSSYISQSSFKLIIIISCNPKSFQRDYQILNNRYKIQKQYRLFTSYEVNIYVLEKF